MAPLRYAAKYDPFLSLDCAPSALHPGAIQGKEGIKFCHLATLQEVGSDGGSNKLVIDTSRDNSVVSGGISGVGTVDEVDNVVVKKSEPLLITTQPINDKARSCISFVNFSKSFLQKDLNSVAVVDL